MGLESIISLIPTIGNVVGSLLGEIFTASHGEALPRKYTFRLGTSLTDEIDVVNDNGELTLKNRTPYSLCVSFPAQNGNQGETVIVPSCNCMPLNRRFEQCAANDVDKFNITAVGEKMLQKALFAGENVLSISAGGTVKVNDTQDKFIGAYTAVRLSEQQFTLTQYDCNGKGELVSLFLQAAGGSGSFNAHGIELNEENCAVVQHNLTLHEGEEVHVSITVNYATGNYAEYMENNNRKYGIRQMSADEIKMLEGMKAVNFKK